MRVTRKALQAENDQLRAQISVHNHVTRKSLNGYVRVTRERNEKLEADFKRLQNAHEDLKVQHAALVEADGATAV